MEEALVPAGARAGLPTSFAGPSVKHRPYSFLPRFLSLSHRVSSLLLDVVLSKAKLNFNK